MSQKEIDRKVKTQESLTFEQSDIWDTIIYIIDEAAKSEISVAIGQHEDESTRAHSCGRAEGIVLPGGARPALAGAAGGHEARLA